MGKHIGDEFYIICSTNPFTAILVNIQEICIIHWGNYSIHQSKCGSRVNNSFCFLRFFLELFHLHLQLLFPTCEQLFHFLCTLSLFTKPHSKSTWFQDAHCLFWMSLFQCKLNTQNYLDLLYVLWIWNTVAFSHTTQINSSDCWRVP